MKKEVIIWLKNGMITKTNVVTMSATSHQVTLTKCEDLPFLIEVKHPGLTTLLDLTYFPDCVILQFGRDRYFTGGTYCQNRSTGNFVIQSQARFLYITLITFPVELAEEITIKEIEQ